MVVELGEATSGIDIDQACELMQEAPQTRLLLVARRLSEKSFKRVLQELPHVPVVSSDAADKIVRSAVDSTLQAPRSG
ncbi:hypothetical protein ASE17_19795 [Phenylobacterium sp. Root77]|nr:hypothetical protein ASC73_17810 [Phenylobacterium sp. Root1277]KQW89681.1 hypothetical protein ASC79_18715 [Phenylobacterium sp. Root1290]KRC43451.1 hypothetical protein ASE17_19795 [Phenylobacterium sp. Root77]